MSERRRDIETRAKVDGLLSVLRRARFTCCSVQAAHGETILVSNLIRDIDEEMDRLFDAVREVENEHSSWKLQETREPVPLHAGSG